MNIELGSLMGTQLWQVSLLAVIIWGVVRLVAANRPHLAHALWLLVLIKCLTPPILSSPTSPFSWLQSRNQFHQATAAAMVDANLKSNAPSGFPTGSDIVIRTNLLQANESGKSDSESGAWPNTKRSSETSETRSPLNRLIGLRWTIVLASVWFGGALINLIVTSIRFLLFWKSTNLRQSVAQPQLERAVSEWSRELGLKQRVRIRVLDDPIGPAVVGLFCPLILLPLVLVEGRSEKDLKPLLTHELIHIRRGDLFWAMIQTLAGCLFWFHPLVRWGVRMVTLESERSCDEETVASLGCSPATYARCLLDVLELKQSLRVAPAVPGIRPVDITSNRMERIMKLGHGCHKRTPLWVWLMMLVCGSIVLPGAALVLGQEEERPSAGRLLPSVKSDNDLHSVEKRRNSLSVRKYDVTDLLEQARKIGSDNPANLLMRVLPPERINPHDPELKLNFFGNQLYVYGTKEDQQFVKDRLNHIRDIGFKQIVVEVFVVTLDETAKQELFIDWIQTDREGKGASVHAVETVGAITTMPEVKFDPGTLVDDNFKLAAHEISLEASNESQHFSSEMGEMVADRYPDIDQVCNVPAGQKDDSKQINALQRIHQAQYAIKPNEEVDRLMEKLKSNGAVSFLQTPTLTLFNGGRGTIQNGSERPFVLELQNIAKGINQPKIGFVNEGMTLSTSAALQSNGSIRLSNKLVLSRIEEDRSLLFTDEPWTTDKPTKSAPYIEWPSVQVPIVSFIGLSSDVEIPKDQTLILNTNFPEANKKIPGLVIIRCRTIEAEIEATRQLPFRPQSPQSQVVIRSQYNDKNHESNPTIERLDNLGVELRLETELERVKVDDGLSVRGQSLIFEWEDLTLSCEQGELELKNNGSFLFSGRKVHLDNAELRADSFEITRKPTEQTIIELRGNAEMTIDERRLKADKIKIFYDDGSIYMEGAGSITKPQKDGEKKVTGNKILVNVIQLTELIIEP